jgi:hypothetical protein
MINDIEKYISAKRYLNFIYRLLALLVIVLFIARVVSFNAQSG